jgi:6-phosphogluconolactonase (cycloisomerase 2 family)
VVPEVKYQRIVLYSAVGPELTRYDVDVAKLGLTKRESITAPANVQYAWPHPNRKYLYLISSPGGPGGVAAKGGHHDLTAYRIDQKTGALAQHGSSQALTHRPLHVCVDETGTYIFVAYNNPSALTVHRIKSDGSIGAQVAQPSGLDCGIFAHQVRVTPDNRFVILVTRGNDAADGKSEDPGALKFFRFSDGTLTLAGSVAPGAGYGFGPRHLDFLPGKPWVYVSLERQNQLSVFQNAEGVLRHMPEFTRDTLAEPGNVRPRQLGGAIHVHPNGKFVYVANRADHAAEVDGMKVFAGGENNIAVFAIDQQSGAPALIQHIDTEGFHVRTFALDPSGRMLVAASILSLYVGQGTSVTEVPAGLSVFRVGDDGRLEFVRRYDVATNNKLQFWMGVIGFGD